MAEQGFRSYVNAYPNGIYARSASGLIRKALWLQRKDAQLGAIYAGMMQSADPAEPASVALIEEIDDKLLVRDTGADGLGPLLAASDLLMQMRDPGEWGREGAAQYSRATLDAQSDQFVRHPDLWSFLQANHAFYVEEDPRAVLSLIPDDARQDRYTPLQFSRQYLRGLALHALDDRLEAGFWQELIDGAKGLYQRPAVELPLAREWEQSGQIAKIFAPDSPIQDARMRRILLGVSAGPELLREISMRSDAAQAERQYALFVGLYKQLTHGRYAGFIEDLPQNAAPPEEYALHDLDDGPAPVGYFTAGQFSDEYACPDLRDTAGRLARNNRDAGALLCLGEFYRLNGFDGFTLEAAQKADGDHLGTRDYYPGDPSYRLDLYRQVIADQRAPGADRAYALYRAIRCYAPANTNTCGGAGVKENRRAGWFRQLKTQYPNTNWAQELEYYW